MNIRTTEEVMYDADRKLKIIDSLRSGFIKHGDKLQINKSIFTKAKNDAFFQINILKAKHFKWPGKNHRLDIIKIDRPFLVGETASFRTTPIPHTYNRLGWYSYQWHEGIFGAKNCDRDRWNKFADKTNIKFKDWRKGKKGYVLILLQKPGDSSLNALENVADGNVKDQYKNWVTNLIVKIRRHTDRPIVIRPHPTYINRYKYYHDILYGVIAKNKNLVNFHWPLPPIQTELNKYAAARFYQKYLGKESSKLGKIANSYDKDTIGFEVKNVTVSKDTTLQQDLKNAHCVVTYNSLSSVEAVQEGVPVIALDKGCMTWPIAHHKISDIEKLKYDIDITQWQNDIAYTQWSEEENKSGESWEHLKALKNEPRPINLCSEMVKNDESV